MNLVSLPEMAVKHGLRYIVLKSRVRTRKIKPVCKKGKAYLYTLESLKDVLFPVAEDIQAQRIASMQKNKAEMEHFKKQTEIEQIDYTQHDTQAVQHLKQIQQAKTTVKALSIYG